MIRLEQLDAQELIKELMRRGHHLKPAGTGIYVQTFSVKEDPVLKKL